MPSWRLLVLFNASHRSSDWAQHLHPSPKASWMPCLNADLARALGMSEMFGSCPPCDCHKTDNVSRGFSDVASNLWLDKRPLLLTKFEPWRMKTCRRSACISESHSELAFCKLKKWEWFDSGFPSPNNKCSADWLKPTEREVTCLAQIRISFHPG